MSDSSDSSNGPSTTGHPAGPSARPVVLIVEDDPDGRELYAQTLTHAGFRVLEAHNGNQALSKALEELPALVITDLALPGIDGFELCRRLREEATTSHIPIVAVTGRFMRQSDVDRAIRDGCVAVLLKPCPPDRLLAEVLRFVHTTGPAGAVSL